MFGSAGAYVHGMKRAALKRSLGFGALSFVVLALFLVMGGVGALTASGLRPVLALLALLGGLGAAAYSYEAWGRYQKAAVGARSESRVGEALERLGATAVVHGAVLGAGGDADHVVLGPCAVVVETKSGGGNVRVDGETILAGQRTIPGSPLRQGQRQARALRQATGCWVDVVVCIPDMRSQPVRTSLGWVCSLADLPLVFSQVRQELPPHRALSVAAQISAS